MQRYLLLVATVGGDPAPVIVSIQHWRPERLVLVPSTATRLSIDAQILPALAETGQRFPPGAVHIQELPGAEDLVDCVRRMRALDDEVERWRARGDDYEVVVDITGGTKCMSAALALCARRWPCRFSYVGGRARTKDGVGVVVRGEEKTLVAANPWDTLGYQAIEEFAGLFNQGAFGAAQAVAERTRNAGHDPGLKRTFATLAALAEAYGCWERFDHGAAANKLEDVLRNVNDLRAALRGDVHRLIDTLASHRARCRRLSENAEADLVLVTDLVANARRRGQERRYDDAVARLYRAVEALAQIHLRTRHGIDTRRAALAALPPAMRETHAARAKGGIVKLGLQEAYALLDELSDPLGSRFREIHLDSERSPLGARNQSILAHGFAPVGEGVFRTFLEATLRLADVGEADLPSFPKLVP
jgi:CRISPR-associated protein (TIGR02710 family)